jgi:hypothetical protein
MSTPPTAVKYQDLEAALEWSSSGAPFENTAIISRQTGQVFFKSMGGYSEEELPEDIDDGTFFVAVPHKNDLNLGRELVFDFHRIGVANQYWPRVSILPATWSLLEIQGIS